MPKVTEEYLENKKKYILDTAYKLCLEKTVSNVTMLDITKKAELSKGGIYRFYKNENVLLADLIDRIRMESDMKDRLDKILDQKNVKSFKNIVCDVFQLLGEEMEKHLMGAEKIDFELNILAMNEPERMKEILRNTKVGGNKEYLRIRTSQLFLQAQEEGKLTFLIPLQELMAYIAAAYSGIQMNCIVNRCYNGVPDAGNSMYSPVKQMHLLATSVMSFIQEN